MKIKHEPKRECPTTGIENWLTSLDVGGVFSIANGGHTYMKINSRELKEPIYVSLETGMGFPAKDFTTIKIADVDSYPDAELHTGKPKPVVR